MDNFVPKRWDKTAKAIIIISGATAGAIEWAFGAAVFTLVLVAGSFAGGYIRDSDKLISEITALGGAQRFVFLVPVLMTLVAGVAAFFGALFGAFQARRFTKT